MHSCQRLLPERPLGQLRVASRLDGGQVQPDRERVVFHPGIPLQRVQALQKVPQRRPIVPASLPDGLSRVKHRTIQKWVVGLFAVLVPTFIALAPAVGSQWKQLASSIVWVLAQSSRPDCAGMIVLLNTITFSFNLTYNKQL